MNDIPKEIEYTDLWWEDDTLYIREKDTDALFKFTKCYVSKVDFGELECKDNKETIKLKLNYEMNYSKHPCMVCGERTRTDECLPSPFLPYSGWLCKECQKNHRIPYDDLLGILWGQGRSCNYEEALEDFRKLWRGIDETGPDTGVEYAEKYWLPTMAFFHKTKEEAWNDAKQKALMN